MGTLLTPPTTSPAIDTPPVVHRAAWRRTLGVMTVAFLAPLSAAHAAGGGAPMPWDAPLASLVNNLTGPTARALVIVAIVAAGLLWAFTRHEEGLKRLGQIAFGGAIAMGAVTMLASLGFAGASF